MRARPYSVRIESTYFQNFQTSKMQEAASMQQGGYGGTRPKSLCRPTLTPQTRPKTMPSWRLPRQAAEELVQVAALAQHEAVAEQALVHAVRQAVADLRSGQEHFVC